MKLRQIVVEDDEGNWKVYEEGEFEILPNIVPYNYCPGIEIRFYKDGSILEHYFDLE